MKIFNKAGSKERLVEMFEKVNKTKVNEKKNIQKKDINENYNQWGLKKKKRNLHEWSADDRYERVMFAQGEDAEEPLQILDNQGEDAALKYLQQWHSPGIHDTTNQLGAGENDQTYEKDGYIMTWNPRIGYIGLEYDMQHGQEPTDPEIGHDEYLRQSGQLKSFDDDSNQNESFNNIENDKYGIDDLLNMPNDQAKEELLKQKKYFENPPTDIKYSQEEIEEIKRKIDVALNKINSNESFDVPKEKDEEYLDNAVDSVQDNKYDDGVRYPVEDKLKVKDKSIEGLKGDQLPFKNEDVQKIAGNELLNLANQIQTVGSDQEEQVVKDFISANQMSVDSLKDAINYHLKAGKITPESDEYYKVNDLLHVLNDITPTSSGEKSKEKQYVNIGKATKTMDAEAQKMKDMMNNMFGVEDTSELNPEQLNQLKKVMGFGGEEKPDLSPEFSDAEIANMQARDDKVLNFIADNIEMMKNYVSFSQFWNDLSSKYTQETGEKRLFAPEAILAMLEDMPEDSELKNKLAPLEDALSKQIGSREEEPETAEVGEAEEMDDQDVANKENFVSSDNGEESVDDVPPVDQAIDEPDAGEEEIEGGLADGEEPTKYDPQQVLRGMEVEMEHTDDPKVALEIAMDHLEEIPDYYDHLDKMEKEATIGDEATPEDAVDAMGDGQEGEEAEEITGDNDLEKDVLWGKLDTVEDEPDEMVDNYKPRGIGDM